MRLTVTLGRVELYAQIETAYAYMPGNISCVPKRALCPEARCLSKSDVSQTLLPPVSPRDTKTRSAASPWIRRVPTDWHTSTLESQPKSAVSPRVAHGYEIQGYPLASEEPIKSAVSPCTPGTFAYQKVMCPEAFLLPVSPVMPEPEGLCPHGYPAHYKSCVPGEVSPPGEPTKSAVSLGSSVCCVPMDTPVHGYTHGYKSCEISVPLRLREKQYCRRGSDLCRFDRMRFNRTGLSNLNLEP